MLIEITLVLFEINLVIVGSQRAENVNSTDVIHKIVGGSVTNISRYPHSVFLIINRNRICGSSIIRDRVLISAAHCFHEIPERANVKAYVGSVNPLNAAQILRANKWIVHHKFSMDTMRNDICLIRLKSRIELGKNAKKIILPDAWPRPDDTGFIAGWGDTEIKLRAGGRVLKSVKQIVRRTSLCNKVFGSIRKSQLCAGFVRLKNLPYSGDSGSALVINGNTQIGIVSCGRPWASGYILYTSIMFFKKWIVDNTDRLIGACRQID